MSTTIDIFKYEKNVEYYAAGDTIFEAGDEGHYMYVIQDGEIEILVNGKVIDSMGPGGVFGEMALIDNSPRAATATAVTDCTLVPVTAPRFRSLVKESPDFALEIMRLMAARLRSMDKRL